MAEYDGGFLDNHHGQFVRINAPWNFRQIWKIFGYSPSTTQIFILETLYLPTVTTIILITTESQKTSRTYLHKGNRFHIALSGTIDILPP